MRKDEWEMARFFTQLGFLTRSCALFRACLHFSAEALSRPMRRFGFVVFLLFVSLAAACAGDWTLVKHDGRDYVTLQNVAQFYSLGDVMRTNNGLALGTGGRTLRGAVGSNELYINNLKFILSYPIAEANGKPLVSRMDLAKIIEPVMRPSRIKDAAAIDTVVLDPGHGGHDNGALSFWGNEKSYTLDVALRVKPLLEQMGLKVQMTRSTDVFIPLEDRVRFANQFRNALFIAIHFNSGGNGSGIETYTLAPRGVPSMMADGPSVSDLNPCPGNVRDAENMALACATHASLIVHSQLYDRGIKRARFVVIRDITIPGVLIEGGFLSNMNDSRRIASVPYRQNMAQCIASAVAAYRTAVGAPGLLFAEKAAGSAFDVHTDTSENAMSGGTIQSKPNTGPTVIIPTTN
jgi:N-acetylmuramoyl-L-alanine amidase